MSNLYTDSRKLLMFMTSGKAMDEIAVKLHMRLSKPDLRLSMALLVTMASHLYPKNLIDLVIDEVINLHGVDIFNIFTITGRNPEYFNLAGLKEGLFAKIIENSSVHIPLTKELLERLVDGFMTKYTQTGPMTPAEIKQVLEKADQSLWVSSLQIIPDGNHDDPINFMLCMTASFQIDCWLDTWLISEKKSKSFQVIVEHNDEIIKRIGLAPFIEGGYLVKEGDQLRITGLTVALIIEAIRRACQHTFIKNDGRLIYAP